MNNKTETINGKLLQNSFGRWKVQSGYGTFPLSQSLQAKPDPKSIGAMVSARVLHGEVIAYHYENEVLDSEPPPSFKLYRE